jgi:hypothetical protein
VEDEQLCHEYQNCKVHHSKGPDDPYKRLWVRLAINADDVLVENGVAIEVKCYCIYAGRKVHADQGKRDN